MGIGGGDIKLMAMIGGLTGISGSFFIILIASISGSITGIAAICYDWYKGKKIQTTEKIPFGPFLSAGALLYIFYGEQLIRWYMNLFFDF